jgi:hypothetical protein
VLAGKLAEILQDKRPDRKVTTIFIDMAFGSPIYERLRALRFNDVFETSFGLVHTPDRTKAIMRAYMWDQMKDWGGRRPIPLGIGAASSHGADDPLRMRRPARRPLPPPTEKSCGCFSCSRLSAP